MENAVYVDFKKMKSLLEKFKEDRVTDRQWGYIPAIISDANLKFIVSCSYDTKTSLFRFKFNDTDDDAKLLFLLTYF